MALVSGGVQTGIKYTLKGPDGTRAVFNDSNDVDYVGAIEEITGLDSPEVRENAETISGQDGGIHGSFYYGRRPITISGKIFNVVSPEDRNKKITKLQQASNAMRADALLEFTPEGGEAQAIKVRRQQPLRVTGGFAKDFQLLIVAADPRVYSVAQTTGEAAFVPSEVLDAKGNGGEGFVASPDGKHLYLANRSSNTVSVFSRDATTGKLTFVETKATGTGPFGVAISPDGKHVYATNRNSNTVSKWSRNEATGKLTAVGAAIASGEEPMMPSFSQSGKWLYVPNFKSNSISVYERTVGTGELVLKETFALPAGSGPASVAVNAVLPVLAVACYTSSYIRAYRRTESTGKLEQEAGVTELESAGTYAGALFTHIKSDVEEAGYARFVAISEGKEESMFVYSVEAATRPTVIYVVESGLHTPGGKPRWFVESLDRYLYAGTALGSIVTASIQYYTWTNWKQTVVSSGNSVGVPLLVEEKHLYVPVANKVYEYFLPTKETLNQMFQNKASGVTATNNGSMETFPVLKITTSESQELVAPIISNSTTGAAIYLTLTIPPNSILEINTLNRTVRLNGVNVFSSVDVVQTSWWTIIPGANEVIVSATKTTGTPKLQVTFNSAWI